jgi:HD-GYP domain-containing protein (c-di-GMP phosphodiesterase class II)
MLRAVDSSEESVATFAQLRARLLTGPHADTVRPGATAGCVLMRAGRATVAVVDAGTPLPAHADVMLVVGPDEALHAALGRRQRHRLHLLPLPSPVALVDAAVEGAREAAEAFSRAGVADQLLDVGLALNAERDPARVLELILMHARSITLADAGSIYLVEDDGQTLRFTIAHNDSVDADLREFTLPVSDGSIVGTSVLTQSSVRIPDLYVEGGPRALGRTFRHDRSFDSRFGYQSRSMITTPMISPDGRVLAVIQLINAKTDDASLSTPEDFATRVRPFSREDERLCSSLAAQAAVALENARLYEEIQNLFEGFVRASVHAIEQRDPTTSGHSQRVADLTVDLARAADQVHAGPFSEVRFTRQQLREIEYAGLLHDFGKVGVREQVLVKAKKLYPHQLELVTARFEHMRTTLQLQLLQAQMDDLRRGAPQDEAAVVLHQASLRRLDEMFAVVLQSNEPTVLPQEASSRLSEVAAVRFTAPGYEPRALLGPDDLDALLIARGSLTDPERREIQSHVTHTYNFLVRIPWGDSLARVPEIAGKHHEYLDGTGYPSAAAAEQIPLQARMMTVSDIFDALTASDRPYKRAVPVDRALDILHAEVDRGKVDGGVLELFIGARIYEGTPA